VSGDVSQHPGIDAPGRHGESGPAARRPAVPEPSLARVLGTTLRLWWRRRVLRVPDGAGIGMLRWTGLVVVVLVLAAAGTALGVAASRPAPARHHIAAPRPDPVLVRTSANERSAAAWIAAQVAQGTPVGCDPDMCARLQSAGLPATQDAVLQAGSALPPSAVVVGTPALRSDLGGALAAGAPETLASFGTGRAQVTVLVTPATTAAAFVSSGKQAFAASAAAGRALSHDANLHLSAAGRHVLISGQVDMRLLVLLQRLVAAHPVYLVSFGDTGPGATWPAQLRSVTIDGFAQGKHKASDLSATLKLLRRQRAPYRAAVQEVATTGGMSLVIQVPAPSPL
jgi:hypothetical protein